MFSTDPARLIVRGRDERLCWWAGPWPVDERWWDTDPAGRTARAQALLETERALLLCYRQRRWYVEGATNSYAAYPWFTRQTGRASGPLFEHRSRALHQGPTAAVPHPARTSSMPRIFMRCVIAAARTFNPLDESVEERRRVDIHTDQGIGFAHPDQSVTVMARVRVPVSSMSTVAGRS